MLAKAVRPPQGPLAITDRSGHMACMCICTNSFDDNAGKAGSLQQVEAVEDALSILG